MASSDSDDSDVVNTSLTTTMTAETPTPRSWRIRTCNSTGFKKMGASLLFRWQQIPALKSDGIKNCNSCNLFLLEMLILLFFLTGTSIGKKKQGVAESHQRILVEDSESDEDDKAKRYFLSFWFYWIKLNLPKLK